MEETKTIFEPRKPVVPDHWRIVRFQEAVSLVSDRGKRVKQSAYVESGKIPVIDQGQRYIGGYTNDDDMAFEGSLPVILFGDHTRSIKYVQKPFAVGAEGIKILKPKDCFDPKFFYHLLNSLEIPSRGYSRHFQFLKKFYLPIAPLNEQGRIVAEVEKQFSRLDEGITGLNRVKANLKRYKAAVLKAAVEGKLTEQWRKGHPDVEPAEKLLDRILTERRKKWEEGELAKMKAKGKATREEKEKKGYKNPVQPGSSDLGRLPNGWIWATADQCTSLITDGEHITPKRSTEGVLLLSARNVHDGVLNLDEVDYIPERVYEILTKRFVAVPGDVLLSCSGSVGRSCIVPENVRFGLVRSVAILKPLFKMGAYLSLAIRSPRGQVQINEKKTQTAQSNIFQGKIRTLLFPIPPMNEQELIVQEVERRFSVTHKMESELERNLRRADRLRQSILKKAFSGRLVLQRKSQ